MYLLKELSLISKKYNYNIVSGGFIPPLEIQRSKTMATKNYGIMKYTKNHKKPNPSASIKYLADIFELNDTSRIVKYYDEELKNCNHYKTSNESTIQADLNIIRSIFLEKQLKKHFRNPFDKNVDLSEYKSDTLKGITKEYLQQQEKHYKESDKLYKDWQNSSEKDKEKKKDKYVEHYKSYQKKDNPIRNSADNIKNILKEENTTHAPKIKKPNSELKQYYAKQINEQANSESNKNIVNDMNIREKHGQTETDLPNFMGVGASDCELKLAKDITGEYVNIPLNRTLKKILDTILGQAEIRAQERGFNRPSRFSHFVKNCFLPVYRCNKPRKVPAFYIDASGSMSKVRGEFRCITSAIGTFLRAQHRRISELRPKYYAFNHLTCALRFDIKKEIPIAEGGTSIGFVANLKSTENNVVITDACFEYYELGQLRLWAMCHQNTQVSWIVNRQDTAEKLKLALSGAKNQKVYYTDF